MQLFIIIIIIIGFSVYLHNSPGDCCFVAHSLPFVASISIFTKFNIAAICPVGFVVEVVGPPTEAHSRWLPHVKVLS